MLGDFVRREAEVPLEAMLDEVILLPAVKVNVERLLEFGRLGGGVGAGVEGEGLVERPLVKGATRRPRRTITA